MKDIAVGQPLVQVGFIVVLAGTCAATPLDIDPRLAAEEQHRISAVSRASQATLAVFGSENSQSGGSGVVISADGFALTNFHVAQPCGTHLKCGMNNGQLYDAVIVSVDPVGDLALIKLIGRDDFPTATPGDSNQLRVGDECFAVGNPFLLATDLTPTVTFGVISGIQRYQQPAALGILEYTDCIQTDAAINPGNSGGPLFDRDGKLIGINGRISFSADKLSRDSRNRVNVGVGYAISMQQAKNFLGVLHSGRVVDHATLGATVATDTDGIVRVTNILDSSDAYRRGLRYGDELIALAGRRVETGNALQNVLGTLPRGWRVPMSYRRDGQLYETHVRLAGVHSPEVLWRLSEQEAPPAIPKDQAPAPDKGQEDDVPSESPEEKKETPNQLRELHERLTQTNTKPLPDEIAAVYEPRHGYSNYYFNRLNRDRVWQSFGDATQSVGQDGPWTISAQVDDQGTLEIIIDDESLHAQSTLAKDDHDRVIDTTQGLQQYRGPEGSGGLYVALHLWRRLITFGPTQFGEVYYWGTAPLPDSNRLYDVLVATYDVVESKFFFDPDNGRLVAMEMYPDIETDPCELYFTDYQEVDSRLLPMTIRIGYGDRAFGVMKIDQFRREPIGKEGV